MIDKKYVLIETKLEVKIPGLPNHLTVKGTNDTFSLPVGQMSKADLRKIGEAWTKELVKKGK